MCVSGNDIWHLDCDRAESVNRAGEVQLEQVGGYGEVQVGGVLRVRGGAGGRGGEGREELMRGRSGLLHMNLTGCTCDCRF